MDTSTAEWSILATMAQTNAWIDALTPSLFTDTAARKVFDWMQDTRGQTGLWSPLAVGCWLESEGYSAEVVDSTVDMLVETAPIYSAANLPAVVGFLIEHQGRRAGRAPAEIALDKHRAGCKLRTAEIEALKCYTAAPDPPGAPLPSQTGERDPGTG